MIRIRAQGKYELLLTTGDDDFTSHDQVTVGEGGSGERERGKKNLKRIMVRDGICGE